jgi:hypothetical protein
VHGNRAEVELNQRFGRRGAREPVQNLISEHLVNLILMRQSHAHLAANAFALHAFSAQILAIFLDEHIPDLRVNVNQIRRNHTKSASLMLSR